MNKTNKISVLHILLTVAAIAVISSIIFAVFVPVMRVNAEEGEISDPDTEPDPVTETDPDTDPVTETDPDTEPVTETDPDTESVTETDSDTDPVTDTVTDVTDTETGTDPVTDPVISEIKFTENSYRAVIGTTLTLEVEAFLSDGSKTDLPKLTYSSSDTNIADVSNGIVSPKAAGRVTVTATTKDGSLTCSCTVAVVSSAVQLKRLTTGEMIATGITPGEDVSAVISDITAAHGVEAETVKVTDAKGNTAKIMATGCILTVGDKTYTVIIYGDTNGNGKMDSDDVQIILDYLTGASQFLETNRACYLAADVLKKGSVTIESALYLQRCIYGISTLEQ